MILLKPTNFTPLRKNQTPNIFVKFCGFSIKWNFITVIKSRAKNGYQLFANELHTSLTKQKVFINYQLTKENKILFWLVKQELSMCVNNNSDLSIFCCIISSIKLNLDNLRLYLRTISYRFLLIILLETWLSFDLNIKVHNYNSLHFLGVLIKSDGVTIFVKDSLIIFDV